jgi:hypothetical protein
MLRGIFQSVNDKFFMAIFDNMFNILLPTAVQTKNTTIFRSKPLQLSYNYKGHYLLIF